MVASEVKNLANQTAKATEEIASQIAVVQGATGQAVTAIQDILHTIDESADLRRHRRRGRAAARRDRRDRPQRRGGRSRHQEVSDNIAGVSEAAHEAARTAQQVLSEAGQLSKQSESLNHEVGVFMARVRAS